MSTVARSEIAKANCAGQGCADRGQCRRYESFIPTRERVTWEEQVGLWCSFDIERALMGGSCPQFVRWHGGRLDRRAA